MEADTFALQKLPEIWWSIIIILTSGIILLLTFLCLLFGITTVFMHLYYFPIILLAYHYQKKGVLYSIFLSVLYFAIVLMFQHSQSVEIFGALLRVLSFIGVALVVALLSIIISQKQQEYRNISLFNASIISNVNVWLTVLDERGNIQVWNRAAEKISGYAAEEVTGKNEIWKNIYPDAGYRKTVTETLKRALSDNSPIENFETVIEAKNGENKTISWNTRKIPYENDIYTRFVAIGVDITGKKQAEEKLRKTETEYRSLISNSEDIISALDTHGNFLFISPSFNKILGYSNDSEKIINAIDLIHPDDVNTTFEKINLAFKNPGHTYSTEMRVRHADGTWRIMEIIGKMSSWGEHEKAVIISSRDITKRKEADENIRKLNEQLISETAALNKTENKLRLLNNELEKKVQERTSELEQVNLALTERNLTLRIINTGTRALLKVQDEAGFIPQICDELFRTEWYSHVWLAAINADDKMGIIATAGDECQDFSKKLSEGQLPACTEQLRRSESNEIIVTPDPACSGCPLSQIHNERFSIIARLNAGGKTVGLLGLTLRTGISPTEQETERVTQIAHEIAFALLYLRTNKLEQAAGNQISKNLEQLAILNDHIRNPLQGIVGYAGMGEGELFKKIIDLSMEIDSIVTKLDEGYLESKKIRDYMELHEHITQKPDLISDVFKDPKTDFS
ncbi:MAG: PAS domain S-box protein [Methanomicrobiaceae archaeon]|nr:PAS domain S-box protein [Methanomicrobiaceae archaeon]